MEMSSATYLKSAARDTHREESQMICLQGADKYPVTYLNRGGPATKTWSMEWAEGFFAFLKTSDTISVTWIPISMRPLSDSHLSSQIIPSFCSKYIVWNFTWSLCSWKSAKVKKPSPFFVFWKNTYIKEQPFPYDLTKTLLSYGSF